MFHALILGHRVKLSRYQKVQSLISYYFSLNFINLVEYIRSNLNAFLRIVSEPEMTF